MKTLAETLGVYDPQRPEAPVAALPSQPQTAREFCRGILNTEEYRSSLLRRIIMDELAPVIEAMLYHYAHGKPVERLEVKDTTDPLDDFTAEQLEDRAVRLLEVARQLRAHESPQDEESSGSVAVH